jgi:RNA polymerase-binding transcription factor DksA
MTPASKGTQVKRVPASGSASTKSGNKGSSARVAATAKKRPFPPKKKAVPVVKKSTTASKKATPSAKKTASAAPKKAAAPAAKKTAPAKKAAATPKKSAPAAKKAAPAPSPAKAPAKKSAAAAPTAKKSTEKAVAKKAAPATGAAAPAPARTTFTPKPKPPAPVRPKTGPYAKDVKFLEEVRALLLADRAIYQEQATSLRAEADSLALEREPGDVQFDEESGEGGTVTVDRERNLALSGQATLAVEEIDDALKRIADKTYGYCERCFQPIPKPRLRALPYARLCVACKSGGLSRR